MLLLASLSKSMVILMFINSVIICEDINTDEDSSETKEHGQTLNQDNHHLDNQTNEPEVENDLSFVRNSSMQQREIPKPWIKSDDLDNRRSEEWADPPLPLRRVRFRSSETDISDYLLPKCGESHNNNLRIVGGTNAQEGAYPWIVVILNNGDPWCGGSILNQQWILTAAHCFMIDANPATYSIRVGSVNRNKGRLYKIIKLIIHERFHLDNMFNSDIALLKVSKKIQLGRNIGGVCLPSRTFEEPVGSEFVVVGWGQLSFESKMNFPEILQEVSLKSVDLIQCSKKYRKKNTVIYRSQLCTWKSGADACQGDSGSAAMERRGGKWYQIGIVSYGTTCADEFPGVFTKVSYFLTWIMKTMNANK